MALTEQKKQEWEETLRKGELISVSDKITDHTQGDLWEMLSQTRGNFFPYRNKSYICRWSFRS